MKPVSGPAQISLCRVKKRSMSSTQKLTCIHTFIYNLCFLSCSSIRENMSAMDLDSTESGPDGGYADMDMDDNIHSNADNNSNSLLSNEQKNSDKRSRDRILHQNYWKDFGDPFTHLVKNEPNCATTSKNKS